MTKQQVIDIIESYVWKEVGTMSDLISRQAAIALAYFHGKTATWDNPTPDGVDAVDVADLEKLPAVQRKQNLAYWIGAELGECSNCGHSGCASDIWNGCEQMFCPNCGAKMGSEENE